MSRIIKTELALNKKVGYNNLMKMKIYLDTSVPSAYFDTSKPIRQLITQKWFENDSSEYELFTSIVAINKINQIVNQEKLNNIKNILIDHKVKILQLGD